MLVSYGEGRLSAETGGLKRHAARHATARRVGVSRSGIQLLWLWRAWRRGVSLSDQHCA
jgi:hypothetical protein